MVKTRVREGGEATRYFCIVRTAIRWLLLLLLILTLIWLAAISLTQRELTTAFVVSSLGLSYTFSKTNFSLIPEVSINLFVHSFYLEFFGVTSQSKAVRSTTSDFFLGCCWQLAEN